MPSNNFKIIKISYGGVDPNTTCGVQKQSPQSECIWGNYKFIFNDNTLTKPDYWVIFSHIDHIEKAECPRGRVLFMTAEPPSIEKYPKHFLRQFDKITSYHPSHSSIHTNHTLSQTGNIWRVDKKFDDLIKDAPIQKTRKISVICSNKRDTPGHNQRYQFVSQLKKHFGDKIDWYGRGIQDFDNEWEALASYEFSIAIENEKLPHYITEKLPNCFLSQTIPLYDGAPNIEDFYSKNAFFNIDINNPEHAIQLIEKILSTPGLYQKMRPALLKAKNDYLMKYQFFPMIVSQLENMPEKNDIKTYIIKPYQISFFTKVKRKIYNKLQGCPIKNF